jgi:uncharacterized repeat protein (TIGR01451 family)
MNRIFTLLLLVCSVVPALAQVVSISPNQAFRGQQLRTTITMQTGLFTTVSVPYDQSQIYLQQGTSIIYSDYFDPWIGIPGFPFPTADEVNNSFSIPTNAQYGYYDVHVITSVYDPWSGQTFLDNVLPGGFYIAGNAGSIDGDVYFDTNQNGVRDVGENGVARQRIDLSPIGFSTFSDRLGHYHIELDSGTYGVQVLASAPLAQTSLPAAYSISLPPDSSGNDFGVYAPAGISTNDQSLVANTPWIRCNRPAQGTVEICNASYEAVPQQGSLTLVLSDSLRFDNAVPAPDHISGDTLHWTYSGLYPTDCFRVVVNVTGPPFGFAAYYYVLDSVFDNGGAFVRLYGDTIGTPQVACAYDPNDKQVRPAGEQAEHYTLFGTELEYQVRFQNTGTDTAFSVFIFDTLDSDLDFSTFRFMGSSHPCNVRLTNQGALKFSFDGILLPDSNVDEPGSNGWLIFRIRPQSGLPDPTEVTNTAHIVFDFNPAIVTNTILNTLVAQLPLGIAATTTGRLSRVYPNPFSRSATLVWPDDGQVYLLTITDGYGRIVQQRWVLNGRCSIDASALTNGLYHYRLVSPDNAQVFNGRLVVGE